MIVFHHRSLNVWRRQRLGTAHGEELPYVFGVPLVDYPSYLYAGNISRDELHASLALMKVLGNFIHSG